MAWLMPLGKLSKLSGFQSLEIPSDDHYQISTDTYSDLWPWRSYRSSPHRPPHMAVLRGEGELSNGYIFLTPYDDSSKDGVQEEGVGFMMKPSGDLVFTPEDDSLHFCNDWVSGMTDFRKQEYKGRPYLTFWNGCNTHGSHWGHRWGRVTFVAQDYTNFTINPELGMNTMDEANKGQIDVHDHHMTDNDTMVVTSYNNTQWDLSSADGATDPAHSWVVDSCFFEVEVETERVLFSWCALDHVPLANARFQSKHPQGTEHKPWDWFHINSAQRVGENYVISSRHHSAVYLISGKDGSVLWELDGQDGGDFGEVPAPFRMQHHARAHNVTRDGMTITLFNNHAHGESQALGFWLPLPPNPQNPPQLIKKLDSPPIPVHAATQGSFQLDVGNGNSFVGYGKIPLAREFGPTAAGEVNAPVRWQARFGHDGAAMSYRAFKMPWRGTPAAWDPRLYVEKVRLQKKDYTKAFVSWNGATDVESWAVYGGHDRDNLRSLGVAKKQGFETVMHVENATCVCLGAIQHDKVVRASNIMCIDDDTTEDVPLEAEKAALQHETTKLQSLQRKLQARAYHLFAEVACAVVLVSAACWAYILWRDRRRRRRYLDLDDDDDEDRFFDGGGEGKERFEDSPPVVRKVRREEEGEEVVVVRKVRNEEGEGEEVARRPFLRRFTPGT